MADEQYLKSHVLWKLGTFSALCNAAILESKSTVLHYDFKFLSNTVKILKKSVHKETLSALRIQHKFL